MHDIQTLVHAPGPVPQPPPEVLRMFADLAPTPSGKGYWCVKSDGAVYSYGDAVYHGGANNLHLAHPIKGIRTHPSGKGYWLIADDGVFAYGAAKMLGHP